MLKNLQESLDKTARAPHVAGTEFPVVSLGVHMVQPR
jgi:hypothetical protein